MTEDGARKRLQDAAMALFAERGFDRTTAAGIAARAGVTERTFFRHFADKREVLFDGEAVLREGLTAGIARAPADLTPLALLFDAFRSMVPVLEANRGFAEPRQALIAATPALQERELAKLAALTRALAAALTTRDVAASRAELAAATGMAAFTQATLAWLADGTVPLHERLEASFAEVAALLAS